MPVLVLLRFWGHIEGCPLGKIWTQVARVLTMLLFIGDNVELGLLPVALNDASGFSDSEWS